MANPNISVSPAPDAVGVPLGSDITIVFDTEIDVGSLLAGNIVITGIEDQLWSGPDLMMFVDVSKTAYDPPMLTVPSLTGPIDYSIDIKRVDSSLQEVNIVDDGTDPSSGNLYQTKVIITPNEILKPNIKYGVIVSTDVTLNTVFDAIYNVDPSSSGKIVATGPYTGASSDTFVIEITGGSSYLDLQFQWYKQSAPSEVYTVNSASKREVYLMDGVTIYFDKGTFTVGDTISFNVVPVDNLDNIVSWSFVTGSGSIIEPSSNEPQTITNVNITDGLTETYVKTGTLNTYIGSSPGHMTYQVDPVIGSIVFEFDRDIDAGTLDQTKISIIGEDVLPDIFDNGVATTITPTDVVVSGPKLFLTIPTLDTSTIYTVTLSTGVFKFIDGTVVDQSKLIFLTRFNAFYTSPAYVVVKAGGATTDVPELLLAEQIGIQSDYVRNIFGQCIDKLMAMNADQRRYMTTVVRDYTTNLVIKHILENSSKLTSMSKGIDTFKIFFGGGQLKPLYRAVMEDLKQLKAPLATCGERGIGQRAAPVVFEKSARSAAPALRQRVGYLRGRVPGLNDEIRINSRTSVRRWRNRGDGN